VNCRSTPDSPNWLLWCTALPTAHELIDQHSVDSEDRGNVPTRLPNRVEFGFLAHPWPVARPKPRASGQPPRPRRTVRPAPSGPGLLPKTVQGARDPADSTRAEGPTRAVAMCNTRHMTSREDVHRLVDRVPETRLPVIEQVLRASIEAPLPVPPQGLLGRAGPPVERDLAERAAQGCHLRPVAQTPHPSKGADRSGRW
jgi:hypothetical protein